MADSHGPVALRALERLPLEPSDWYLDIGCGNGYTVRWAADQVTDGVAIGIDVAPMMIARARGLSHGRSNVAFQVTTFPEHNLPRESFRAIFTMEVLYYLPNLDAALAEIARLLVPGGRVVSVVDYYRENEASHSWPEDVGVAMNLLSAAEWRAAFARAGLSVVEQAQLTQPKETASEAWKSEVGSLMTVGQC